MTYCVGLLLNDGIVCLSDTRTNAGLDNISTYRKMFSFEEPGERVIVIMTAGSLSVSQTALAQLREAIEDPEATPETSIMLAPTMLKVAEIVGRQLAGTHAEQHSPHRQVVELHDAIGQHVRVVVRQRAHTGAELDALRTFTRRGDHHLCLRADLVVGRMVRAEPDFEGGKGVHVDIRHLSLDRTEQIPVIRRW